MDKLQTLLGDPARCGIYHLNREPSEVERAALAAGLVYWRLDIGHVHDKEEFLKKLATTAKFPDWFGGNWDALSDCLTDLSWHQAIGYVLLLEKSKHFAAGHRHEFDEAMDVLAGAAKFWREQGRPFWVLVGGAQGWDSGFAPMPES